MVISMFSNYKIEKNVLYLYVDDKCEIGSFFGDNKDSLVSKVKEFIKQNKINFNGVRVVLVVSGLLLGTVYLNKPQVKNYDVYDKNKYVDKIIMKNEINYAALDKKVENEINKIVSDSFNTIKNTKEEIANKQQENSIPQENKKEEIIHSINSQSNVTLEKKHLENNVTTETDAIKNDESISVKRSNGEIINIPLEEYLIGVVGSEMPASFNIEALKAQAVASRTYAMKLLEQQRIITDSVSTQVYKTNNELMNLWGTNYNMYYNKVKSAVDATKGLYMTYNGKIIDAVYHSTSNGYTEDSINVWGNSIPYLKTVTSPWDTSASSFLRTITYSISEMSNKLGFDFNYHTIIEIISKDESNRISKIKIGDNEYTGVELRNILGLRSADFDIEKTDNGIKITTRGYGHGVGMSQYGANGMANSGYSYDAILKHYYTGINIVK